MLAKHWLKKKGSTPLYFNWDEISTRQAYFSDSRFFESPARSLGIRNPWIVFDEIHKRPRWRDILKGAYDLFGNEFRFLITGSARLDIYRKGGDSLQGRYHAHRRAQQVCAIGEPSRLRATREQHCDRQPAEEERERQCEIL